MPGPGVQRAAAGVNVRKRNKFKGRPFTAVPREAVACVYYIRCSGADGLIKIGKAIDPHRRLNQLQTGSGETLTLLATEPGGLDVERRRHRQFSALRVRGEWFRAEPALLEHIEALRAGASSPVRASLLGGVLALLCIAWLFFETPVLAVLTVAFLVLRWYGWRDAGYETGRLIRRLLSASARLVKGRAL